MRKGMVLGGKGLLRKSMLIGKFLSHLPFPNPLTDSTALLSLPCCLLLLSLPSHPLILFIPFSSLNSNQPPRRKWHPSSLPRRQKIQTTG